MGAPESPLQPEEDGAVTLMVPASVSAVRVSAAAVRGIAESVLSADDADHVEVVVAEVGNNIVIHGFGGGRGEAVGRQFTVRVMVRSVGIVLEFVDDGPPFDPVAATPGTPEESLARGGGGLGLYIMRQVADELTYRRVDDRNILTLVKRRRVASACS